MASMLASVQNSVSKWAAMRCQLAARSAALDGLCECGQQLADELFVCVGGVAVPGFQLVAQRHQFIDFGNDAVLFFGRRQSNNRCNNFFAGDIGLSTASSLTNKIGLHSF